MRPKLVAVKSRCRVRDRVVLQEVASHCRIVYVCVRGAEDAEGDGPARECVVREHVRKRHAFIFLQKKIWRTAWGGNGMEEN